MNGFLYWRSFYWKKYGAYISHILGVHFLKYKKRFLLRKYKKFFNIRARKFHFPKNKEFYLGLDFFYFLRLGFKSAPGSPIYKY